MGWMVCRWPWATEEFLWRVRDNELRIKNKSGRCQVYGLRGVCLMVCEFLMT